MHKKTHLLLLVLIALTGIFLAVQIRRTSKITVKTSPELLISEKSVFIPTSNSELILGNPGAPVTIVEFMDFNCKECLSNHSIIKQMVTEHPQEIRLIWKDAPQPKILSKNFAIGHQAALCVAQQDERKFWQFIDIASQNTNNLQESGLKNIAQGLNLDTEKWWQCTNNDLTKQTISSGTQMAKELGLTSFPAIFVNNKQINTKADINLKEMLENFIKP
jgi:protein-disulfide isomerase